MSTDNGDVELLTGSGNGSGTGFLSLLEQVTVVGGSVTVATMTADVRLTASGSVTQGPSGTITADELGVRQVSTSRGRVLDDANDVNQLAASNAFVGGTVVFQDVDDLTVETVSAGHVFSTGGRRSVRCRA